MSNKKRNSLLASSAAVALLLAACGGSSDDSSNNGGTNDGGNDSASEGDGEPEVLTFDTQIENEGEAIDGGTMSIGYVSDSPFTGIFSWELYSGDPDAQVMAYTMGELFGADENYQIDDSGAATMELDQENNTVTITVKDGITWHDGEPLTADDVLYAHEIIADPDYAGVRYTSDLQNIVGIDEYKNGNADSISGMTLSDDNMTLTIQYQEVGVQMLQAGGGIWGYAAPRHYTGDIPVADLESAPEIREKPLGYGPFKVDNIVPGESVSYSRYDEYWRGKPVLDGIELQTVPTSTAVAAMENAQFDLFLKMPTDQYDTFADLPGYKIAGRDENSYTYIGFKLGEWQEGEGDEPAKNVYNPDAKMADKNLRKAMAYSIDNDAVGSNFYQGLRRRATSPIIPNFSDYYNEELEGYPYNLDEANKILDDAGYEWDENEEYRLTPEGEELVINFASMSGSDVAEPISEYYIQSWKRIGLNVQLLEGRLHEFNSFYDRVEADDPKIDIYQGAWGTGTDPTPDGLYGETAPFNYTRWVTDENNEYMEQMLSAEGFDTEWRAGVFNEWQEYFMEELPIIPTLFRTEVFPVNNRVGAYDITVGANPEDPGVAYHTWYLTSDTRATE
ncbi:oligopeptide ABC transporter substrate-binding protein [Marinilactibacillus kalidii]|uniref:oligopeptide ABC transporter substrate-binding protein n=1 Tax=Marinilactibacillus kalidii TaxID=2820274 RepID=UPI001ABDCE36|nr:oligopeptide ABC transporter substrate-binding protein [Marinilactibacillus kalidii]